jgi:hypothetical protein
MPMQRLSPFIVAAALLAACSGPSTADSSSKLTGAAAVAKVTAVLDGAGRCVTSTCTMHFAADAIGDSASFSSTRCGDGSCPTKRGRLTAAAQGKAREIGGRLAQNKLEEGYGCPGCADGPTYVVVVHRSDGTKSSHTFDPFDPEETLPQPLRDASALMDAVSGALGDCRSSDLLQVEPGCTLIDDVPTGRP